VKRSAETYIGDMRSVQSWMPNLIISQQNSDGPTPGAKDVPWNFCKLYILVMEVGVVSKTIQFWTARTDAHDLDDTDTAR